MFGYTFVKGIYGLMSGMIMMLSFYISFFFNYESILDAVLIPRKRYPILEHQ
jgi:hypothetical protein